MRLNERLFFSGKLLLLLAVLNFSACKQKPAQEGKTTTEVDQSAIELTEIAVPEELAKEIDELLAKLKQQESDLAAKEQRLQQFQKDLNEEQLRLANLQAKLRSKEIDLVERENQLLARQKSLKERESSIVLQRRIGLIALGVGVVAFVLALIIFLRSQRVDDSTEAKKASSKSGKRIRASKQSDAKANVQTPVKGDEGDSKEKSPQWFNIRGTLYERSSAPALVSDCLDGHV
jgi:Fe2+ transport system protein B